MLERMFLAVGVLLMGEVLVFGVNMVVEGVIGVILLVELVSGVLIRLGDFGKGFSDGFGCIIVISIGEVFMLIGLICIMLCRWCGNLLW